MGDSAPQTRVSRRDHTFLPFPLSNCGFWYRDAHAVHVWCEKTALEISKMAVKSAKNEKIDVLHSSSRQVPFILLRFLYIRYPRAWRTTTHRLHERNEREKGSKSRFGRGERKPLNPFLLHKLTITENDITIPRPHAARYNGASNAPGLNTMGQGWKSVYF